MRWLLSLIFIMVTLSSASATETRAEYIEEMVCHAVAGCWINPTTGECPDCVTETRKIVTIIKNPVVNRELNKNAFKSYGNNLNNKIIATTNTSTKKVKRGRCIVGECDW